MSTHFTRLAAILAVAATPFLAAPVMADDDDWDDRECRVATGASRIEISRAIEIGESLGYRIFESEIDDGCIELKGSDTQGARVKLRLDPVSGAVIPYRR